jgi:NADPH-dependent curcumin reductase CurA
MKLNGRIPVCGMIAQYNATTPPPGPRNIIMVVPLRLTIKGFIVSDHADMAPQFIADMAKWTMEGKMKWQETIKDGVEKAPEAFIGLFSGDNSGKMVVRVGPDKAV